MDKAYRVVMRVRHTVSNFGTGGDLARQDPTVTRSPGLTSLFAASTL